MISLDSLELELGRTQHDAADLGRAIAFSRSTQKPLEAWFWIRMAELSGRWRRLEQMISRDLEERPRG